MGARLPRQVAESYLSRLLMTAGLQRVSQGKVRDTFTLPGFPGALLMVATDRLSIFDFVLPCSVPDKGRVLTAMTVFWLKNVLSGYPNHLIACGPDIDRFLPQALQGNAELQSRSLVVKNLQIIPVECVVRGYLTGSAWKDYQKNKGIVCGHQLPPGLYDGAKLPEPIFTPATKAELGHDTNITADDVGRQYGRHLERMSLQLYHTAARYALSRHIIIADTKFELGQIGFWDVKVLADEALTPDSSRFWTEEDWKKAAAQKKSPPGFDKQPVREWGKTVETPFGVTGIDKLEPENLDHVVFVHQLQVPQEVIEATTRRYVDILDRLTGQTV